MNGVERFLTVKKILDSLPPLPFNFKQLLGFGDGIAILRCIGPNIIEVNFDIETFSDNTVPRKVTSPLKTPTKLTIVK